MKNYNTLYYLLFVLLVMGAFASMAQNRYGLIILGGVAIAFSLLFLVQFIAIIRKKELIDRYLSAEYFCLFIFSSILALSIFYIHFKNVELVFAIITLILAVLYCRKAYMHYRYLVPKTNLLAIIIMVFYVSIVFFLLSMMILPVSPQLAQYAGIFAFILLVFFILANFLKKDMMVDGEHVTAFRIVNRMRDNSLILISAFFLFSLYTIFTRIRVLPKIYSDEFPQAYFDLIDNPEAGKKTSTKTNFDYQDFKEKYDQFVRRNGIDK